MRISDWSSDVCSSDLSDDRAGGGRYEPRQCGDPRSDAVADSADSRACRASDRGRRQAHAADADARGRGAAGLYRPPPRSEEPTSELQSLMRTSYVVYLLKQQTQRFLIMI